MKAKTQKQPEFTEDGLEIIYSRVGYHNGPMIVAEAIDFESREDTEEGAPFVPTGIGRTYKAAYEGLIADFETHDMELRVIE